MGWSVCIPPYKQYIIMLANKVVSKAPGKVLIAGGYGVLEQGNLGLALAVDKYFYSVSESVRSQQHQSIVKIDVHSPQIKSKWNYTFDSTDNSIHQGSNLNNPFLQNAIKYSLIHAYQSSQIKVNKISITILQDRGFLSQSNQQNNSKFIHYGKDQSKTGLGSSATVIVVTVQAILKQVLKGVSKIMINGVSQVANLAAQNKIGSNFDISTAVFGSHLYINTLPAAAFTVTTNHDFKALLEMDPQVKSLEPACETLRKGYCCMIDLKKGSNTRKMVSGFIKALNEQESSLIREFYQRSKQHVTQIFSIIANEADFKSLQQKMKALNSQYRKFLQLYSSITKIPVEPPQLQPFLDHICNINNVLYAICPGSGGYDAIFVLTSAELPEEVKKLHAQLILALELYNLLGSICDIKVVWREQTIESSQQEAISSFLS